MCETFRVSPPIPLGILRLVAGSKNFPLLPVRGGPAEGGSHDITRRTELLSMSSVESLALGYLRGVA